MDEPSTNWKFLKELSKYRSECEINPLIDICSSGLHIIHGAFKTGSESTSFKGLYILLQDDYSSITGSNTYHLSFCATRWIEDKNCCQPFN